ncbi:MAG: valine--tRNA ligase [Candidatus Sungbacteria bacterium]|nr:valine--tRNA ligase [bacterium]MDZ4260071.1 valine--tRNA ligase [Candidatus Sungbacteria bacterium]
MSTAKELSPQYQPHEIEDRIYRLWEESGFFNPDNLPKRHKKPFCVIMPPPNASGAMHIGNAVGIVFQDIMIRFARMSGKKTLWLPGTDHAGFETQVVFDKKLEKEGRSRFKISREELFTEMLAFTQTNKKIVGNQLQKLGASCDLSREKFTLDPDIVEQTQKTFVALHNNGLIYRGTRIVNWCIKHQTALADLETKYKEQPDPLYYMKYGPLVVATVRPETRFGDVALAVHPKDPRYKNLIGKEIEVDAIITLQKLKVIADDAVDPKFGTGVVKVTPSHDSLDFEMGKRHGLDSVVVIDRYGKLNEHAGIYQGLKILEARKKVIEDLQAKGLIEKVDAVYVHNISVCYKCETPIEPRILPQWFLTMRPLAKKAIEAVEKKRIVFVPPRFKKIYLHWLKNIRDWNLSQQITWGIRIPAWFCACAGEKQKVEISLTVPKKKCAACNAPWQQDPDVLTTWFSSSQWPYLALGYPQSRDFKTFYPTDVMETGWDILLFWVSRMVMLGLYRTGTIPFKTIYLHGLVRDRDRQKMSKSKGNVIDPLGIAEMYGTDAVRMALVVGNLPGNDIIISEEKIRGYRNFANKIWNATRFVLMHTQVPVQKKNVKFGKEEKAMLVRLKKLTRETTRDMERMRFHHAADRLYHFFWHYYADEVIEKMKSKIACPDGSVEKETARALLLEFHRTLMILLHPFMPFITEEIWSQLSTEKQNLLLITPWPSL